MIPRRYPQYQIRLDKLQVVLTDPVDVLVVDEKSGRGTLSREQLNPQDPFEAYQIIDAPERPYEDDTNLPVLQTAFNWVESAYSLLPITQDKIDNVKEIEREETSADDSNGVPISEPMGRSFQKVEVWYLPDGPGGHANMGKHNGDEVVFKMSYLSSWVLGFETNDGHQVVIPSQTPMPHKQHASVSLKDCPSVVKTVAGEELEDFLIRVVYGPDEKSLKRIGTLRMEGIKPLSHWLKKVKRGVPEINVKFELKSELVEVPFSTPNADGSKQTVLQHGFLTVSATCSKSKSSKKPSLTMRPRPRVTEVRVGNWLKIEHPLDPSKIDPAKGKDRFSEPCNYRVTRIQTTAEGIPEITASAAEPWKESPRQEEFDKLEWFVNFGDREDVPVSEVEYHRTMIRQEDIKHRRPVEVINHRWGDEDKYDVAQSYDAFYKAVMGPGDEDREYTQIQKQIRQASVDDMKNRATQGLEVTDPIWLTRPRVNAAGKYRNEQGKVALEKEAQQRKRLKEAEERELDL